MGFYGNITNTSRTQFQYDRIYSSRTEMDSQKYQDSIYAGRYVLVEYDQAANLQLDTFLPISVFKPSKENPNRGTAESVINGALTIIRVGDMRKRKNNPYVYTYDASKDPSLEYPVPKNCVFYKWVNSANTISDSEVAEFEYIINSDNNYTINYNLDTENYGEGRGYDSTVWQKMYIDNLEKYVMIAELNTVVPTFEVSADAPTMNPITPHFDTGSTDVYYKLHYQPQWGVRVKGSEQNIEVEAKIDEDKTMPVIIKSSNDDQESYPSDHTVKYNWSEYDPKTGVETNATVEYPAAIYYNKAGFESAVRTHYDGKYEDEISIRPTGLSGNKYNNHDGTNGTSEQVDIQELKILLPAIGNMVSDTWDMVYGYRKEDLVGKNENNEDVVIIPKNTRYHDISWKDAVAIENDKEYGNAQNIKDGGMTRGLETLAGCINYVHDLMGMIITDKKDEYLVDNTWYNKNYIYKEEDKYYRICEYPVYTITDETFELPTGQTSDQQYNSNYKILLSLLKHSNYYISDDNGNYILVNKNAVPNLINAGENVYYQKEIDGVPEVAYKYIEMPEFANNLTTINGLLLELRRVLNIEETEVRDFKTIQGIKNSLNDIINMFNDLIPGYFVIVDNKGNIESANWTTEQNYGYINYGTGQDTGTINKVENRWIRVNLNEKNNIITIEHQYNPAPISANTPIKINLNEDQTDLSANSYDNIDLYTPIVDYTGHIIGRNSYTITLPYGYKIIKIGNSDAVTEAEMDMVEDQRADNTQDTLSLIASNKWIKLDNADEDTIKFGHKISDFIGETKPNTLYGLLQNEDHTSNLNEDNKFEVPCLSFDEAGHITEARTHTVTLPENYDKVEVVITPENFQNEKLTEGTAASIAADSMTDTLTFKQGNKWALLTGNATDDSITFSHYVDEFNQTENSTDFNNTDSGKVFYTQEIAWDEAGHLISSNKHNFTLPDNFKTIAIANSGAGSNLVNISVVDDSLVADTLVDTATIDTGNKWIRLVADKNNDKVTIYHAPAGTAPSGNTTFDNAETPNYGVAFTIPEVKYDEAGHIYSVDTHTVKFPTPSLNDWTATGSSVLTGIKMDDGALAIEQTNADVGTLKLAQYIQATGDTLTADDTINNAFRKLSTRIQAHEDDLNALIGGKLKEKFDTLVEMSDWLDANDTEIIESINKLNTDLTKAIDDESTSRQQADNTINTTITNLTNTVSQNNTTLTDAINKEITDRENAVKIISDNLSAETEARIDADNIHTANIKTNADAISNINDILSDKFDENTLFNWGYEEVLSETKTDKVVFADGSYRIDTINTYTSVEKQATLQSILDEIRVQLNLYPQTADRTETIPGDVVPAPEIDEEIPTT